MFISLIYTQAVITYAASLFIIITFSVVLRRFNVVNLREFDCSIHLTTGGRCSEPAESPLSQWSEPNDIFQLCEEREKGGGERILAIHV